MSSEARPGESGTSLWRDRRLWLVAAVALAVRAGLLAAALGTGVTAELPDSPSYEHPAQSFLAAGIFSQDQSPPYTIDILRTPGYPLFLAGVWRAWGVGNHVALEVIQVVLSVLAVILVYAAARPLVGRRGAVVAGLLLAVSGLSAALPCYVLGDALFQFWMALWLLLLVRYVVDRSWVNLLAVAVVAGLGSYVRPAGMLLPGVVALVALWPRAESRRTAAGGSGQGGGLGRRLGQAVAVLLVPALILFPWMVRNHLGADTWEPTVITSWTMLNFRAPEVKSIAEGQVFNHEAQTEFFAEAAARTPANATPGERSRIGGAVALEYMRQHPWATARAYANGAVTLLLLPDHWGVPHLLGVTEEGGLLHGGGGWYEKARAMLGRYHGVTLAYMAWETAWLGLVWLMALAGWLRLRRRGQAAAANALVLVVICLLVTALGPEAVTRYRAPLLVPLVVLAGAMWWQTTKPSQDRRVSA